jgi:hypothetical protein
MSFTLDKLVPEKVADVRAGRDRTLQRATQAQ